MIRLFDEAELFHVDQTATRTRKKALQDSRRVVQVGWQLETRRRAIGRENGKLLIRDVVNHSESLQQPVHLYNTQFHTTLAFQFPPTCARVPLRECSHAAPRIQRRVYRADDPERHFRWEVWPQHSV